eukprot:204541-Chlamydomonas_euryale.AAC.1
MALDKHGVFALLGLDADEVQAALKLEQFLEEKGGGVRRGEQLANRAGQLCRQSVEAWRCEEEAHMAQLANFAC